MLVKIVRLLGVAYVGALSFILAFLASHWLDQITPPLSKKHSKLRTFLSVVVQFALIGALIYLARGFIKKVPFPLNGVAGYDHAKLGELRSLPLIVFIFMFFQRKTQDKMRYLIETQSLIPTAGIQVPS
jgi:hypothetical protein